MNLHVLDLPYSEKDHFWNFVGLPVCELKRNEIYGRNLVCDHHTKTVDFDQALDACWKIVRLSVHVQVFEILLPTAPPICTFSSGFHIDEGLACSKQWNSGGMCPLKADIACHVGRQERPWWPSGGAPASGPERFKFETRFH
ncbi:hypothetical protein AVEN_88767-1 [Araneus ventricosus]|uniref:Uncharacterized protein n=1 Tax=Araneus ventricosus TaxID=182803 RepID=A0A4Y2Q8Q6_ARAVE|nr:hypothetical protein AVEN_88767-1 [Araneus ventricosus]